MRGAPARQAAAMFAIEVEILVQRDERETPRGAQPEVIILDAEQPGVIAAQRLGHARAIEEAGADIIAVEQPIDRSEEHTSELQSLMRISYAVFCLKKKRNKNQNTTPLMPHDGIKQT